MYFPNYLMFYEHPHVTQYQGIATLKRNKEIHFMLFYIQIFFFSQMQLKSRLKMTVIFELKNTEDIWKHINHIFSFQTTHSVTVFNLSLETFLQYISVFVKGSEEGL